MIQEKSHAWLKEFLLGLCTKKEDRNDVDDIVDSFQKLWRVAKAAEKNPYPRSPRLNEALSAIKDPEQPRMEP